MKATFVVILVAILLPPPLMAELLAGKILEVVGNEITIALEGMLAPSIGDPVAVSKEYQNLGPVAVGQWAVTSVAGRTVTANLVNASGPADLNMDAAIDSDSPVPIQEIAGEAPSGLDVVSRTVADDDLDDYLAALVTAADQRSEADIAVFRAIELGGLAEFRAALDAGADPTQTDGVYGERPLDTALHLCKLDMVIELSDRGIDILEQDRLGVSPLSHAATGGHWECVALLLELGGDVNARVPDLSGATAEANGATPLMLAAREGNADAVLYLLATGADPELTNRADQTALDVASEAREDTSAARYDMIVSALRDQSERSAAIAAFFEEALYDVISDSYDSTATDLMMAEILLRDGGDANTQWEDENSLLTEAVDRESLTLVETLLDHGADPNVLDENQERTPLMDAVLNENEDIVALLLTRGADTGLTGPEEGRSALHMAAARGNLEIFGQLLDAGADPNVRNETRGGRTPLDVVDPERRAEFAALVEQRGN